MREEWLTYQEAMDLTGRSKRTLNRWLSNPDIPIKTIRPFRQTLLLRADLMAAEALMDERTEKPTFGKRHTAVSA